MSMVDHGGASVAVLDGELRQSRGRRFYRRFLVRHVRKARPKPGSAQPKSQRAVYDERYSRDGYDKRSEVRVLTAEAGALRGAVRRALANSPGARELSLLDFGYGTGRVVNEFLDEYPEMAAGLPLRVLAYDVASVGLQKAERQLRLAGFDGPELLWDSSATTGYVAGTLRRRRSGVEISVVFIHASEDDSADCMRKLIVQANDGASCWVTCSWYSALGHIFGAERRRAFFEALGRVTHDRGELVVAVSGSGDLVEAQHFWWARREAGNLDGAPIEVRGDVLYETELGQMNYYHVFGTDLADHLREITGSGQRWWIEGVRVPADEFSSIDEEQANYEKVQAFNTERAGLDWTAEDYRLFHTVAGFRSAG